MTLAEGDFVCIVASYNAKSAQIAEISELLNLGVDVFVFFFSSRRRHTRFDCDWSSDVCSSDLEGLRVAIIGDIAHSRVARSNVHLLSKFGVEIVLCGPASLLPVELSQLAPGVQLTTDIREAIRNADVIMMLRVQL